MAKRKTTKRKTTKRKAPVKRKAAPKKQSCACGNVCWFCIVMLILILIFTWVSGEVWSKVLLTIFAALALICHFAGCGKK